ncbi:MAG TPA: hypothetical protein VNY05_42605 [Candidatus Acidoferrales bacterium]|nr:hypothetical protein [Candidatus Acidoferrales bacterium]
MLQRECTVAFKSLAERKELLGLAVVPCRFRLLINFNAVLIKDGITRIVNGLQEEALNESMLPMITLDEKEYSGASHSVGSQA